jgi:hypothetical protein
LHFCPQFFGLAGNKVTLQYCRAAIALLSSHSIIALLLSHRVVVCHCFIDVPCFIPSSIINLLTHSPLPSNIGHAPQPFAFAIKFWQMLLQHPPRDACNITLPQPLHIRDQILARRIVRIRMLCLTAADLTHQAALQP